MCGKAASHILDREVLYFEATHTFRSCRLVRRRPSRVHGIRSVGPGLPQHGVNCLWSRRDRRAILAHLDRTCRAAGRVPLSSGTNTGPGGALYSGSLVSSLPLGRVAALFLPTDPNHPRLRRRHFWVGARIACAVARLFCQADPTAAPLVALRAASRRRRPWASNVETPAALGRARWNSLVSRPQARAAGHTWPGLVRACDLWAIE